MEMLKMETVKRFKIKMIEKLEGIGKKKIVVDYKMFLEKLADRSDVRFYVLKDGTIKEKNELICHNQIFAEIPKLYLPEGSFIIPECCKDDKRVMDHYTYMMTELLRFKSREFKKYSITPDSIIIFK